MAGIHQFLAVMPPILAGIGCAGAAFPGAKVLHWRFICKPQQARMQAMFHQKALLCHALVSAALCHALRIALPEK
ncbi:MAG: hypothetical protein IJV24_00815 [Prevotella sp.]|nr:hypothetical protein [Prevotella sp.]